MFGFGLTGKITRAHVVGAAVGVGVVAVGYCLYKRNKQKVDEFLRSQGINVKTSNAVNYEDMSIESLTEVKEHLEDLIAEKEANSASVDCEICMEEKK